MMPFDSDADYLPVEPADAADAADAADDADDDLDGWAADDSRDFDNLRDHQERAAERETAAAELTATESAAANASPQYTRSDYELANQALGQDLEALAAKYELGEMEFSEYRKQERELEDIRAQLGHGLAQARQSEHVARSAWERDVNEFLASEEGAAFVPGGGLNRSLAETLDAQFRAGAPANLATLRKTAGDLRKTLRAAVGVGEGSGGRGAARNAPVPARSRVAPVSTRDQDDDFDGWAASSWR